MTKTELPEPCPFGGSLPVDQCGMCLGTTCAFHRPDQMPCNCSVAVRHEPTRGEGHITSGGYEVGTIQRRFLSASSDEPGICTIRLVGGAGDGQEVDGVETKGGLPPKAFKVKGYRYERFTGPDRAGVWTFEHTEIPGVSRLALKAQRDHMPESLKGMPSTTVTEVFAHPSGTEIPDYPPIQATPDAAAADWPRPVEGQSGRRLQPGEEPVIHDMGGAKPPPTDEAPPGQSWVQHTECAGRGCDSCQEGWVLLDLPQSFKDQAE